MISIYISIQEIYYQLNYNEIIICNKLFGYHISSHVYCKFPYIFYTVNANKRMNKINFKIIITFIDIYNKNCNQFKFKDKNRETSFFFIVDNIKMSYSLQIS